MRNSDEISKPKNKLDLIKDIQLLLYNQYNTDMCYVRIEEFLDVLAEVGFSKTEYRSNTQPVSSIIISWEKRK